ncbi:MAG TPA: DUF4382 domain-containing protein [Gallionella sp.]|nr:DUF4382 domain-containing protein [Gallionella sp.]
MKVLCDYPGSKPVAWLMASLLAVLVAGCGSGGNGSGSGTLAVSLTDTPACGFDAVYVTVVKVRVHQSSSAPDNAAGWTDITLNPARKINLLGLNNGILDNLGETPLAAGHYTQLRLVLDPNTTVGGLANSVVPAGGTTEFPLYTPSAIQSGVKLINQFDVASGQRVDLVLDFNACKSVVTSGNGTYVLKPVIKVIPFTLNGIDGFVDPALLGSNVMVTAQQNGVVVQSTAPNAATGKFFLARIAPGNYDVVITADNHATAVIASVPVAGTTSVVNVSDNVTRITLPVSATRIVSGTATLSPASSTEAAYMTAKQTVPPIVTVKTVAADGSVPSTYSLTLPIGVPQLGPYSALPIVFTAAQSGVAGIYAVEASATGYATQSRPEDISAADATAQDFTLVP